MQAINFNTLKDLVVRPGIEDKLIPLVLYKGNLSLGDIHKRWNMTIAAMLADCQFNEVQQFWWDDDLAKLCFVNTKNAIGFPALSSWFGRIEDNPKVAENIPGLLDYVRSAGGSRFSLDRIPVVTHRWNANVPWRTYKTKPRKRKVGAKPREQLFYPYLIHEPKNGGNSGYELLTKINDSVPKTLPDQIRADVCQDLAVAILSGDMEKCELDNEAPQFVKKVFRLYPTKYGPISLDQSPPWADDSFTLLDVLTGRGI